MPILVVGDSPYQSHTLSGEGEENLAYDPAENTLSYNGQTKQIGPKTQLDIMIEITDELGMTKSSLQIIKVGSSEPPTLQTSSLSD